jgi:hypothetical protein
MKPIKANNKTCPICKKKFFGSFIVINGGAMQYAHTGNPLNDYDYSYTMLDKLDIAFLRILNHGPNEVIQSVDIIKSSPSGQFDLYLCSIDCLKKLFDNIIDELKS